MGLGLGFGWVFTTTGDGVGFTTVAVAGVIADGGTGCEKVKMLSMSIPNDMSFERNSSRSRKSVSKKYSNAHPPYAFESSAYVPCQNSIRNEKITYFVLNYILNLL